MTDQMKLWDAVSKTNPADTKHVSQRGGFTSICAHSQIREATRQFGPIGVGWGYSVGEPIFHDRLLFVQVTLWHGQFNQSYGPMTGGAEWQDKNGRLDSDAAKKATTDALTKLLSQLGFNADVFLRLYDDNKYVEQMRREFAEKESGPPPTITEEQRTELVAVLNASTLPVAGVLKRASENAGREIKDLRDLPATEFEGVKSAALSRPKEKEPA